MCDFITPISTLPFLAQFANTVVVDSAVIFRSSLRDMVKKEISSDHNWKEAFWETAFRCVNSTPRVTRFSSVFTLLTQFSEICNGILVNALKLAEAKEISSDENEKEGLLENYWWCVNSSHRVTRMFHAAVHYHSFWGTREGTFWIALRPTLIKEFHLFKRWKKLSEKLLSNLWVHLTDS